MEVDYYKKLFQTIGNIIELIEKDDIPKYLLFLENAFPYMDNYNYHKGMNGIIQELTGLLKTKNIGTDSDRALLLDFQATLETKPEKAIKLEKDALAQIETITADNTQSGLQRLEICRSTAGILFKQFSPTLTVSRFRKINQ